MVPMDAIRRLNPPLRTGERVTLRVVDPARDLIGFVTCLAPLTIEDRHGRLHQFADGTVQAPRRVAPALGRDPASAPRELLDELADRAGIAGEPALHRISDRLAELVPTTAKPRPSPSTWWWTAG